ncbi:cell wall hydrolase [Qipengyuania spongiae]|uniref:Cell wall hydrolase n=1 Tax=Qipengyuania spongiae TaxID=2909673 RepID=A0ABY5T0Y9_9SPHN|nr:cell wall hydrolase [Qipengyuania spongiae]UVI38599.1 cell wall hydrolase [Qipengyuania spongiae]
MPLLAATGPQMQTSPLPPAQPGAPRRRKRPDPRPAQRTRIAALSALLVAATLPTVAQSGSWRSLIGLDEERAALTPMPFETAGQSFPGSAFYWVEEQPRLAFDVEELRSAGASSGGETITFGADHDPEKTGLAAPAFQSAGSGLDKARALQCLSMAVYYEAASESYEGQRAVAQVVLNRVAHPAYPASVCGVVFQGSERSTGCQFTFTCDGSLARTPSRRSWAVAQSVALSALAGDVFTPVGTATHYHTHAVHPYWAPSLDFIGSIGAHRFYRWKGRAGLADAFSISYRGDEPLAAPRPREPVSLAPLPDTTTPARGGVAAPLAPVPETVAAPMPATPADGLPAPPKATNDRLPSGGQVKPEYARSGRWIDRADRRD